jgi:hypothetical protein
MTMKLLPRGASEVIELDGTQDGICVDGLFTSDGKVSTAIEIEFREYQGADGSYSAPRILATIRAPGDYPIGMRGQLRFHSSGPDDGKWHVSAQVWKRAPRGTVAQSSVEVSSTAVH